MIPSPCPCIPRNFVLERKKKSSLTSESSLGFSELQNLIIFYIIQSLFNAGE